MNCPKCGISNRDDDKVCRKCGSSLETYVPADAKVTTWKWKPVRWWVALIAFWLISTIGAGILVRVNGSYEGDAGFIILVMLIFACLSAFTDRSWSIQIRIVWVLGIWVMHALLSAPMTYIIGVLIYSSGRPELANRGISLLAAFPLVVWALRRSKLFVEPGSKKAKKEDMVNRWLKEKKSEDRNRP